MQRLEVSGAVRLIYRSLGVKGLTAWDVKFSRWSALGSRSSDTTALAFYVNTNISEEPAAKIPGSHIPEHLTLKAFSCSSNILLSWNSVTLSRVSSATFTLCDLLRQDHGHIILPSVPKPTPVVSSYSFCNL